MPLLAALAVSAALGACAPTAATDRVSSTVPAVGAEVVGAGGKLDDTYRQIYAPGDPNWSH